jgi:acyl carrier protein phosphodiesterase
VNFFAHAVIAHDLDRAPRHLLGSMLPDFCGMARVRLREAGDEAVRRGVDLHHRTDDVFHGHPRFLRYCGPGAERLTERGLGRGPARAVAHVGTEMLLDGLLLERRADVGDGYLAALEETFAEDLGLTFKGPEGDARFERFRERLRGVGLPDAYRQPEGVFRRLLGALSRRPRLALKEADAAVVVPWLEEARETLAEEAETILRDVADGVG